MRVEKKLSKSLQKSAVVASALILSFAFLPGSANAVETQLTLGSASTYGVLASSTITNAGASTVTGIFTDYASVMEFKFDGFCSH